MKRLLPWQRASEIAMFPDKLQDFESDDEKPRARRNRRKVLITDDSKLESTLRQGEHGCACASSLRARERERQREPSMKQLLWPQIVVLFQRREMPNVGISA